MSKSKSNLVPAPQLSLLASLYFSQGLPFGFFSQSVPVLMRKSGFSLGTIGLSSLLALPWALKFLWAPLVDRLWSKRLGRRRGWILICQLLSILLLVTLSIGVADNLKVLLLAAALLNLLSATQDIATDALAVERLEPKLRGIGNGIQVAGYRLGMIVGGGLILVVVEWFSIGHGLCLMALFLILMSVPIYFYSEPSPPPPRRNLHVAHFVSTSGAGKTILVLLIFKFGDAFANGMLRPLLVDRHFSMSEIGLMLGGVGFSAGLAGALAAGMLINRVGIRCALISFSTLQAIAIAGYIPLALSQTSSFSHFAIASAFEHFAGGMATAALFTQMMNWSRREAAATDYTTQACIVVIASGAASSVAGFSAQTLGYPGHFVLATVAALAVPFVLMANASEERTGIIEEGL